MTKILIVDDEPMARMRIRKLAESRTDISAIEEAEDGIVALTKIAEFEPDVVYLDIDMPEMSGFEMLENMEHIPFAVVFQTAYHQFAIKAFEVNACDYLLKPFTDERWTDSLERAKHSAKTRDSHLTALKNHLHKEGMFLTRIVIRSGNRNHVLKTEDISHFTSENHITFAHTCERSFGYEQSLSFLEEKLDPTQFLRVHRNAIVKLDCIKTFTQGSDGLIILKNNVEIHVSREKRRRLREILEK